MVLIFTSGRFLSHFPQFAQKAEAQTNKLDPRGKGLTDRALTFKARGPGSNPTNSNWIFSLFSGIKWQVNIEPDTIECVIKRLPLSPD